MHFLDVRKRTEVATSIVRSSTFLRVVFTKLYANGVAAEFQSRSRDVGAQEEDSKPMKIVQRKELSRTSSIRLEGEVCSDKNGAVWRGEMDEECCVKERGTPEDVPRYHSLIGEVELVDVNRVGILILVAVVLPVDGHSPPVGAGGPVRASDVERVGGAVQGD